MPGAGRRGPGPPECVVVSAACTRQRPNVDGHPHLPRPAVGVRGEATGGAPRGSVRLAREASRPVPGIDSPAMPPHDVLIIGAALAGQRAALAAARSGATVAIMSKVPPVRSHSNAAAGGINAALNPDDSWESHAFDTVKGSDYLGDQDAIEIMCREAPNEVLWL